MPSLLSIRQLPDIAAHLLPPNDLPFLGQHFLILLARHSFSCQVFFGAFPRGASFLWLYLLDATPACFDWSVLFSPRLLAFAPSLLLPSPFSDFLRLFFNPALSLPLCQRLMWECELTSSHTVSGPLAHYSWPSPQHPLSDETRLLWEVLQPPDAFLVHSKLAPSAQLLHHFCELFDKRLLTSSQISKGLYFFSELHQLPELQPFLARLCQDPLETSSDSPSCGCQKLSPPSDDSFGNSESFSIDDSIVLLPSFKPLQRFSSSNVFSSSSSTESSSSSCSSSSSSSSLISLEQPCHQVPCPPSLDLPFKRTQRTPLILLHSPTLGTFRSHFESHFLQRDNFIKEKDQVTSIHQQRRRDKSIKKKLR